MAPTNINRYSAFSDAQSSPDFGKSSENSVPAFSDKAYIGDNSLNTTYTYQTAFLDQLNGQSTVKPTEVDYKVNLNPNVFKKGLFLVGLGGNNGSTLTAIFNAIRHNISLQNKNDLHEPNFFGSDTEAVFMKLGINYEGKHVYASFKELASTLSLYDFVVGGWDINKANLKEAMARSKVIHNDLQRQVGKYLEPIVPLPSVYYPDFIAANQEERADNVIPGTDKWAHVEHIRKDIRDFKEKNELDHVVVLWTANTERDARIIPGVNDTADNLLKSIKESHSEISPSTIFAVAAILENVPYINSCLQNTFVPGCVELAKRSGVFVSGDVFESRQTEIETDLTQFLYDVCIIPGSMASYNHLSNNDRDKYSETIEVLKR